MPGLFESFGPREGPSDIAGALVDAAGNPASRRLGAASGFQWAWGAIFRAAEIKQRGSIIHEGAARRQALPRGANIAVGGLVVAEVRTRESPVFAPGPVEDRDMRRDLLLLDKPIQHWGRSVGGIAGDALRLEAKALFGTLEHGPRGTHLGLANSSRGLDIHDDAAAQIDQIIVCIGKEGRPFEGTGPLRGRVGGRDELGLNLSRGTKGC